MSQFCAIHEALTMTGSEFLAASVALEFEEHKQCVNRSSPEFVKWHLVHFFTPYFSACVLLCPASFV